MNREIKDQAQGFEAGFAVGMALLRGMDRTPLQYASDAAGALEDCRGLLRDVGKFAGRAGLPESVQNEAARIRLDVEQLEARIAEFAGVES